MSEDKSFTDIMAKPGIALKLKALILPSVRISYEGGQTYALLPPEKGYFFGQGQKESEPIKQESGLYGKLSQSLNKISEKLSSGTTSSHFSTSEKNKLTLSERSRIEKNTIRQSDSMRSEKLVLSKTKEIVHSNPPVSNFFSSKTVFAKQPEAKSNSLAALSVKLNDLMKAQSRSVSKDLSLKAGDMVVNQNNQKNTNVTGSSNSFLHKSKTTSQSVSSESNFSLSTISGNTSIFQKQSAISLRDYSAGLEMLHNRRETISKSSLVGGASDRTNAKPKASQNYITQNFGDIIIQPASLDVSVQQVKYKIEDVLRQVRDSLY